MTRPLAPAYFIGEQERLSGPPVQLFNLTETINEQHVKGSTVSRETLERAGFRVPEKGAR
ncbi:MAG TPA: hypothetical protein VNH84_06825 [Candidatus Saccharimonadales bacterium]|nr:hypothetical protein [Candidatus Saccharimonadales bacterium]